MRLPTGLHRTLIAALLACCAAVPAAAQDFPDKDTREISAYVLTEAGLAKFTKATANLGRLAQRASGDCESESATSIDDAVARFDAVPGAKAAIQSAGMTTREYIVFTWSLFQNGMAAWAVSQPGGKLPAGVSKANVDFYRAHEAAMQQLGEHTEADECNGASDEPEEE